MSIYQRHVARYYANKRRLRNRRGQFVPGIIKEKLFGSDSPVDIVEMQKEFELMEERAFKLQVHKEAVRIIREIYAKLAKENDWK